MTLDLTAMIANAPPPAPPPRLVCDDCPALQLRNHPAPAGTTRTARCAEADRGRLIAWHHQAGDARPHWCPREARR